MKTTVYYGGKIYAGTADGAYEEAVAVTGNRFLAYGSLDEVAAAAGLGAQKVNLDGATMVPGLVESHVHLASYGLSLGWVDLRPAQAPTVAELLRRLAEWIMCHDGITVLRAWGYDDTLLAEGRHPTRADLDTVSTEVPMILTHVSGHFCVGNSAALTLAGISDESPDPEDGAYQRDEQGRLTGLMREGQIFHLLKICPEPTKQELETAIHIAMQEAAANGMTTVHDLALGLVAGISEYEVFKNMAATGQFSVRVKAYISVVIVDRLLTEDPDLFTQTEVGKFTVSGAKLVSDGSIQGFTAALTQPYFCNPHSCGDMLMSKDSLMAIMTQIDNAGGQIAVHANGDRAIKTVLQSFTELQRASGRLGRRHRIEHFQTAQAEDAAHAAKLGIGCSIFANHIYYWGDRHRDLFLGPERAARISPCRDAVSAGLHFGLHSDCPVTPMAPLKTMWTAVARKTASGKILGADQALSPAEALFALTGDSAWLTHSEDSIGRIGPGYLADAVVVDRDILSGNPDDIRDALVLRTMVDGEFIYERLTSGR